MKPLIPNIAVLTGMRGIAANLVLIAHAMSASFNFSGKMPLQALASDIAYFGMSLFFILSGFVIFYNYQRVLMTEGLIVGGLKFIWFRFVRLYPLYLLLLFCTLNNVPSSLDEVNLQGLIVFLTLTQSWFNMQLLSMPPAWSISTEIFFYVFFCFFFRIFNLLEESRLNKLFILFIYLFTVFLFLPTILRYEINYLGNDNGWVIYFSPYTRIFEFVSGVLVAMVFKTSAPRDTKYLVDMCLVLIFSLLVYILFYPVVTNTEYDLLRTNFFFAPIICLILFLLTCYNSRISKILGNNIFSFFGEISYSTYLMSFPVISLLNASFVVVNLSIVGYISGICKVIACFILTTLMAYGSYLLIEKPSRKLLR